jgi:putative ABC transport system ATP-binding protein
MTPVSVPVLSARRLGRRLGDRWIWRGVDLELSAGNRGMLVGASGTGKSLLLRCLCALDRPDEGQVLFAGRAVKAREVPTFRSRVLYVQQSPALIPGSVSDNVELPGEFGAHAGAEHLAERAADLFSALDKPADFLAQRASRLSGGEAQLVGLVRALVLEPSVLLLDEPTAHLDSKTTSRVEDLIHAWTDAGSRAVLWTSHDPVQVERVLAGPLIELPEAR